MAKVKKMAIGGLGGVPAPAMPGKVMGNAAPIAKPIAAPAPTIAPKPVALAPARAAVAPPPMSRMRMMMARMRGMRFEDGGKVSTAKKNKSAPNW